MRLWKRILIAVLAVVVLAAAGGLAGGGWYLSDILKKDALTPNHNPAALDMRVSAVSADQITLEATTSTSKTSPWRYNGEWGMRWDGGYARVGMIQELTDRQVTRVLEKIDNGDLRAGDMVRLEGAAYAGDPQLALGIAFQEVRYTSSLGIFGAWYVPGDSATWAIIVHGRNAPLREGLRILPPLTAMGYPALLINYRNDDGMPTNGDGLLRYGQTEWQDLEGAVGYAIAHGAKDVVLVGYSMGGAVVVSFLYQSPLAGKVRGVILDAPMMDFNETIDLGVKQRGYPVIVAGVAKAVSGLRFGVDWGKLDYLRGVDRLKTPILLFHGDADPTVPIATSDALAAARPDLVQYVRVPGALHVGAWNRDPSAYEAAVRDFLAGIPE